MPGPRHLDDDLQLSWVLRTLESCEGGMGDRWSLSKIKINQGMRSGIRGGFRYKWRSPSCIPLGVPEARVYFGLENANSNFKKKSINPGLFMVREMEI